MTKLRQTLRTAADLVETGLVSRSRAGDVARVAERYAVAISPAMAELIDARDPDDPIARQFIPDIRELDRHASEREDPIGDHPKSPLAGLVHRYPDRVLLKVAAVCPVYCRFCFRREMVGPDNGQPLSDVDLDAALDYIRAHPGIWEVILTGGDPLVLSPRRIADITARLGEIAHVKILRWHTRVPVVAPERVTADLVAGAEIRSARPSTSRSMPIIRASSPRALAMRLHSSPMREFLSSARPCCSRASMTTSPRSKR